MYLEYFYYESIRGLDKPAEILYNLAKKRELHMTRKQSVLLRLISIVVAISIGMTTLPANLYALAPPSSFNEQEHKRTLREILDPKSKAIVIYDLKKDWPLGPLPLKGAMYISDAVLLSRYPTKFSSHKTLDGGWNFLIGYMEGEFIPGYMECMLRFVEGLHAGNSMIKNQADLGRVINETMKNSLWHGNKKAPNKGILLVWDETGDSLKLSIYDEGASVLVPGTITEPTLEAFPLAGAGYGLHLTQDLLEAWESQAVWDKHGNQVGTGVSMIISPDGFSWRPFLKNPQRLHEYLKSPGWMSLQVDVKVKRVRQFDLDSAMEIRDIAKLGGKNAQTDRKSQEFDAIFGAVIGPEWDIVEKLQALIKAGGKYGNDHFKSQDSKTELLAKIKELHRPELLPFLVRLYREETDPEKRATLAKVFVDFQPYSVQDILLELIHQEEQTHPKSELIKALGLAGEPRMAQYLLKYLDHQNAAIAKEAMIAIANVGNAGTIRVDQTGKLRDGLANAHLALGPGRTLQEIIDPEREACHASKVWERAARPLPSLLYIPDTVFLSRTNSETTGRIYEFIWIFLRELLPRGTDMTSPETMAIAFPMRETLKNCLFHANDMRPDKGIYVSWRIQEDRMLLDYYDEGETVFIPWLTNKTESPDADILRGSRKGLVLMQQDVESWRVKSIWDSASRHVGHKISIGVPLRGLSWKRFLDRPERLKSYLESSAWMFMDIDAKENKLKKLDAAIREGLTNIDADRRISKLLGWNASGGIAARKETLQGAFSDLYNAEWSVVQELKSIYALGDLHFKDKHSKGKLLREIQRLRRPELLPFLVRMYRAEMDPDIRKSLVRTFQIYRPEYVQDILLELAQQEDQPEPKGELLGSLGTFGRFGLLPPVAHAPLIDTSGVDVLAASL